MYKPTSVSLIVSTYNWPEALKVCLLSIINQKVLPDEVIVADDGSKEETKELIEKFKTVFPVPLKHIWQKDDGFQLSRIRNKAIAASSKEYIIQIDGDLILHPRFVDDHIQFSIKNSFTTGSRVMLDEKLSKLILREEVSKINIFSRGVSNQLNGIRLKILRNFFGRTYKKDDAFYMRGCNMAFWRNDLLEVNGYNEEFVGWGREDNEIAIRLMNKGVNKRSLKFGAIAFHIYHKESTRKGLVANEKILSDAIKAKKTYCPKGISQYLNLNG